jgi:hypothetical protein
MELGMTQVPTIGVRHLTAAQAMALMIADNALRVRAPSFYDE